MLAIGTTRATSRGAFWGLTRRHGWRLPSVATYTSIAFLWHNVVGAVTVVVVGYGISLLDRSPRDTSRPPDLGRG